MRAAIAPENLHTSVVYVSESSDAGNNGVTANASLRSISKGVTFAGVNSLNSLHSDDQHSVARTCSTNTVATEYTGQGTAWNNRGNRLSSGCADRYRILSDTAAVQLLAATDPDEVDQLRNLDDEALRMLALQLVKDNHTLRERLDSQMQVMGDLYGEIDELQAVSDQLKAGQRRKSSLAVTSLDHIKSLEDDTAELVSRIAEKDGLLDQRQEEIKALKTQLEAEQSELRQILDQKAEQCEHIAKVQHDNSRLLHQLDEAQRTTSSPPKFRQVANAMVVALQHKRAAQEQERHRKRLRALKYLHDLWRHEMEGASDEKQFAVMATVLTAEAQESKEDILVRLHNCHTQLLNEKQKVEELQQQKCKLEQDMAGLQLVLCARRHAHEQWRLKHAQTLERRLAEELDPPERTCGASEELERRLAATQEEASALKNQLHEAVGSASDASYRLNEAETQLEVLRGQLRIRSDIEKELRADFEERLALVREEAQMLRSQLQEKISVANDATERLVEREAEIGQLQGQLQKNIAEEEDARVEAERRFASAEERARTLQEQLQDATGNANEASRRLLQAEAENAALRSQLQKQIEVEDARVETQRRLAAAEEDTRALRDQLNDAAGNANEVSRQLSEAGAEKETLRIQLREQLEAQKDARVDAERRLAVAEADAFELRSKWQEAVDIVQRLHDTEAGKETNEAEAGEETPEADVGLEIMRMQMRQRAASEQDVRAELGRCLAVAEEEACMLRNQVREAASKADDVAQRLRDAESENEALRSQMHHRAGIEEETRVEIERRLAAAQEDARTVRSKLNEAASNAHDTTRRLSAAEAELEVLRGELRGKAEHEQDALQRLQVAESKSASLTKKVQMLESTAGNEQDAVERLRASETEVESLRQHVLQLTEANVEVSRRLQDVEAERGKQQERERETCQRLRSAETELGRSRDQDRDQIVQAQAARTELEQVRERERVSTQRLQAAEAELQSLRESESKARQDLASVESQLSRLLERDQDLFERDGVAQLEVGRLREREREAALGLQVAGNEIAALRNQLKEASGSPGMVPEKSSEANRILASQEVAQFRCNLQQELQAATDAMAQRLAMAEKEVRNLNDQLLQRQSVAEAGTMMLKEANLMASKAQAEATRLQEQGKQVDVTAEAHLPAPGDAKLAELRCAVEKDLQQAMKTMEVQRKIEPTTLGHWKAPAPVMPSSPQSKDGSATLTCVRSNDSSPQKRNGSVLTGVRSNDSSPRKRNGFVLSTGVRSSDQVLVHRTLWPLKPTSPEVTPRGTLRMPRPPQAAPCVVPPAAPIFGAYARPSSPPGSTAAPPAQPTTPRMQSAREPTTPMMLSSREQPTTPLRLASRDVAPADTSAEQLWRTTRYTQVGAGQTPTRARIEQSAGANPTATPVTPAQMPRAQSPAPGSPSDGSLQMTPHYQIQLQRSGRGGPVVPPLMQPCAASASADRTPRSTVNPPPGCTPQHPSVAPPLQPSLGSTTPRQGAPTGPVPHACAGPSNAAAGNTQPPQSPGSPKARWVLKWVLEMDEGREIPRLGCATPRTAAIA